MFLFVYFYLGTCLMIFIDLRCVCNKFSKTIGFKNGNPICRKCDYNQTVTTDGKDCIVCKNNICKCSSNEILSTFYKNTYLYICLIYLYIN